MEQDQWRRVSEIFDHVADKSPSHRADYLDIVCEGEPELRAEIERMLAANEALAADGSIGGTQGIGDPGVPQQVGEYRVLSLLGSGGMGSVYRCVHPEFGEVALKLLPAFLVADPVAQLRFRNEAQILSELKHPSLCRLYEYFITDDYAAIAMELADGNELTGLMKKGPIDIGRSVLLVRQLCETLQVAHQQGVYHRDIKPGNIIVGDEELKLIDFGVAKFADLKLTATGQAIGSPNYMSPEQWQGKAVDGRTDLWSLGVIWYQMLTGQRPFEGGSLLEIASAILLDPPRPMPASNQFGEPLGPLRAVIDKLLTKNPDERIASCSALLARLPNPQ